MRKRAIMPSALPGFWESLGRGIRVSPLAHAAEAIQKSSETARLLAEFAWQFVLLNQISGQRKDVSAQGSSLVRGVHGTRSTGSAARPRFPTPHMHACMPRMRAHAVASLLRQTRPCHTVSLDDIRPILQQTLQLIIQRISWPDWPRPYWCMRTFSIIVDYHMNVVSDYNIVNYAIVLCVLDYWGVLKEQCGPGLSTHCSDVVSCVRRCAAPRPQHLSCARGRPEQPKAPCMFGAE